MSAICAGVSLWPPVGWDGSYSCTATQHAGQARDSTCICVTDLHYTSRRPARQARLTYITFNQLSALRSINVRHEACASPLTEAAMCCHAQQLAVPEGTAAAGLLLADVVHRKTQWLTRWLVSAGPAAQLSYTATSKHAA